MKFKFSRYQKWIPVALLGIFIISSLIFVALVFQPTAEMTVNDGKVIRVKSRSEAEIEVYKTLPYKASFKLTTGPEFEMDLRYLGFSYFSEKELERLDAISAKSFWGKFTPFFDTSQSQLIAVYPQRTFWLTSVEKALENYPHLLRREAQTNHLTADEDGNLTITAAQPGYTIAAEDFVEAVYQVGKTGNFDEVPLKSTAIEAEDQSSLLAQYPTYVGKQSFDLPTDFATRQNVQTAFSRLQNIYLEPGETLDIAALMGDLTAKSGYKAVSTDEGDDVYGAGVEQIIDTIKELAYDHMTVDTYKGRFITIGQVGDGLTELTVTNTSGRPMVFSLAIENDSLSVVLAAG